MKPMRTLLTLMVVVLSSMSLFAQDRYEGIWPEGEGVLYSNEDGLIFGTFIKGKPDGRCVCYKPNGEVYWGDFRKGKATGHGRIYRDNGIVVSGDYKNGKYHGIDTLYRTDGTVLIARYGNGKLKEMIYDSRSRSGNKDFHKPQYPRIDFEVRQELFLREQELRWEERNLAMREKAGLISPKFQGGGVDDFALWVNSQVVYPVTGRASRDERMVIVEFTVCKDGSVSDVYAVFGTDAVLNEAAVKAVSSSPKWTPGEQNGEKKNIRLSVPVMFSL